MENGKWVGELGELFLGCTEGIIHRVIVTGEAVILYYTNILGEAYGSLHAFYHIMWTLLDRLTFHGLSCLAMNGFGRRKP